MSSTGSDPFAGDRLALWLHGLQQINGAVNQAMEIGQLLDLVARTACEILEYPFCTVLLVSQDSPVLLIKGSFGLSPDYAERVNAEHPILLAGGDKGANGSLSPSSRAFSSGVAVSTSDTEIDEEFEPWAPAAREQGYRAMLSVPLRTATKRLGVLNAYVAEPHDFSSEEIQLLETLAIQAAIAIEAAELRESGRAQIQELQVLNRELTAQKAEIEQLQLVHRRLTEVVLSADSVQPILRTLTSLLGSRVEAVDRKGDALGDDRRGVRPAVGADGKEAVQLTSLFELARGEPAARYLPTDGDQSIAAAPINVGHEQVGCLVVRLPRSAPTALQLQSLEHGALAVALQLQQERVAQEVEWRLRRDLLGDLLIAETDRDRSAVVGQAARMGHDLAEPHAVVVLRLDRSEDADVAADEVASQRRLQRIVLAATSHATNRPLVAARGRLIVLLQPLGQGAGNTEAFVSKIRARVSEEMGRTISVAHGGTVDEVDAYAPAYRLARGALKLTEQVGRTGVMIRLDELGIYRVLLQVRDVDVLNEVVNGLLGPVLAYDEKRDGALIVTLRAYFEHGCANREAASALHIHPNTLAYRLGRIQDLLSVDLKRPQALMQLQFAMMVHDVLVIGAED